MPPKKKARTEFASWELEGDEAWEPFAEADAKLIEDEYVKGSANLVTSKLSFNKGYNTKYTFDFKTLTQTNNDSKKQRKIRRVAPLSEIQWEWKDDSGLFVPFYDDDSAEIERLFTLYGTGVPQKTKKLSFNKGYDTMYTFVFATAASTDDDATKSVTTGTQKNEDSGKVRELRRIQKKLPWKIEGYGISSMTATMASTIAAATTAAAAAVSSGVASATAAVKAAVSSASDGGASPAATEAAAVPDLLTRSGTLSVPTHWTGKSAHVFDASGTFYAAVVAPDSEEFTAITSGLVKTVGKPVSIVSVKRIENATLWTFYAMTRDQIAKKNGGNANERMLFYGDRIAKNMDTIQRLGFDVRVAEDGLFGIGLYFGAVASFCDSGRCLQNSDGSKVMLVCRAAIGATQPGAKGIRRPPPKDPKKPTLELYDSCTDAKPNHELYVIFNNSQVYPEYVVTYA